MSIGCERGARCISSLQKLRALPVEAGLIRETVFHLFLCDEAHDMFIVFESIGQARKGGNASVSGVTGRVQQSSTSPSGGGVSGSSI
jgi:hypothetical protein